LVNAGEWIVVGNSLEMLLSLPKLDLRSDRGAKLNVALTERIVQSFAFGDVGRHAPESYDVALRVEYGKLVNDARVQLPVTVTGDLLELYSRLGGDCLGIIRSELDREFLHEDLGIGMGNHLPAFQTEGACERVVDIQVTALWILDKNEGRAVVHECMQTRFAGLEP
jgi:hypothetical protein